MIEINHECYVSPEVAKLLEQAGFDWKCKYAYIVTPEGDMPTGEEGMLIDYVANVNWAVKAPTLEVAQRWLREVKNIAVYTCPSYEPEKFVAPNVVADDEKWLMKWQVSATPYDIEEDAINLGDVEEKCFDTCEEAQEAGIQKVLEIILNKN